jgi:DNA-binding CsgD family transcriptional regulator
MLDFRRFLAQTPLGDFGDWVGSVGKGGLIVVVGGDRRARATGADVAARSPVRLSAREHEILALLADGQTQSEIADVLYLSSETVSTHIQHVLVKLGVHSPAQAVAAAFKLGLVGPDVLGATQSAERQRSRTTRSTRSSRKSPDVAGATLAAPADWF